MSAAAPAEAPAARPLGSGSLLALGLNGIVGVGIFFVPAGVAGLVPGRAGALAYLGAAACLVPVAVAVALLGRRFDEDGGPYVWARAAFGPRIAFAFGWLTWVSALFSTTAVVTGLATHLGPSLGFESGGARLAFGAACVTALALTVAAGLRPSAIVWSTVTWIKLAPLGALLAVGAAAGADRGAVAAPAAVELVRLPRAMLLVTFALQGFEIVPVPARHARAGARSIPLATLGSLGIAVALYVGLHLVCVDHVPALAASGAPLAAAAHEVGGAWLGAVVRVGTNLSALGIALGMVAMTPRYLAALGGPQGLGEWASRERRGVPVGAVAVTAAIVIGLSFAGSLSELFALSSVAVVAQYAVTLAALAALGARRALGLGPAHLAVAALGVAALLLLVSAASSREALVAGGVVVVGWVARTAARRASAGR
ncbi:MAG: APC family permease [Polyangiaceae bacterium]|nr:APC family permease [Polyangiaceae bacterium]